MALNLKEERRGESSNTEVQARKWKSLWDLKVPVKVKNFLWRITHNSLPTNENLFKQRVVGNMLCPLCNQESETTIHLIWISSATNDVWISSCLPIHKWSRYMQDFHELWDKINYSLEQNEKEQMAFTMRCIWVRRNTAVFQNKISPPNQTQLAAI